MLSFTRKNGQLSFYLAHKLYKNGPKKGTVPEKINSHYIAVRSCRKGDKLLRCKNRETVPWGSWLNRVRIPASRSL